MGKLQSAGQRRVPAAQQGQANLAPDGPLRVMAHRLDKSCASVRRMIAFITAASVSLAFSRAVCETRDSLSSNNAAATVSEARRASMSVPRA